MKKPTATDSRSVVTINGREYPRAPTATQSALPERSRYMLLTNLLKAAKCHMLTIDRAQFWLATQMEAQFQSRVDALAPPVVPLFPETTTPQSSASTPPVPRPSALKFLPTTAQLEKQETANGARLNTSHPDVARTPTPPAA